MLKRLLALISVSLLCLVSGCGQSGPLYLPKDPPPVTTNLAKSSFDALNLRLL